MSERDAFGPGLKAERDRRGITLQAIADSTKIGVSLLAALEHNDVSRWPKGIFRRAFVREYVSALGLPPEPIVAEFVRLFPDGTCAEAPASTELRLTLESQPSASWSTLRVRVTVAGIEACTVVALGSILAWALAAPIWSGIGSLALAYYSLAGIALERTPRPRLIFPLPRGGRLRTLMELVSRTGTAWPRPTAGMRGQADDDIEDQGTAPEWRTASN
ncbi:MAG: helix-turn-helix domain-containing protein [Acidobacteria bacterium]|nr:helix-turn-helix domain-containing protein [Acidobacteriota bacterium]